VKSKAVSVNLAGTAFFIFVPLPYTQPEKSDPKDCLIIPLFDHKGTKSQRLEGKTFVALCLGDFVVNLLNSF